MKFYNYGNSFRNLTVLIGVWEPLTESHFKLISFLRENNKNVLPIVLNPPPTSCITNEFKPIYESITSKMLFLKKIAGKAVQCEMTKNDYRNGDAYGFIKNVIKLYDVESLVVYENQSFGRGPKGSTKAIKEACESFGIEVQVLKQKNKKEERGVQNLLGKGELQEAITILGRHPIWERPEKNNFVFSGWFPGIYKYQAVRLSSDISLKPIGDLNNLHIFHNPQMGSGFFWPKKFYNWIYFLKRVG
jgi:FAD synthase